MFDEVAASDFDNLSINLDSFNTTHIPFDVSDYSLGVGFAGQNTVDSDTPDSDTDREFDGLSRDYDSDNFLYGWLTGEQILYFCIQV